MKDMTIIENILVPFFVGVTIFTSMVLVVTTIQLIKQLVNKDDKYL